MGEDKGKENWWHILIGVFFAFLISGFFLPAITSINFKIGMVIFVIFLIGDVIIYLEYNIEIICYILNQ